MFGAKRYGLIGIIIPKAVRSTDNLITYSDQSVRKQSVQFKEMPLPWDTL